MPWRTTDELADVVWWARGLLVGGVMTLLIVLSVGAVRGASVVNIGSEVQDPNEDPLHVTVTWTITGGVPGPNNATCDVTSLLVQRSVDDGPWGAEPSESGGDRRILVPLNATSGTFPEVLASGHLWRIRVQPEVPAICQSGGGGDPEPSNAIEFDLRSKGWLGLGGNWWCCGAIVPPVIGPIGLVYVAQRRKRMSACPSCAGTGRIPAGAENADKCLRCSGTGKVRE